MLHNVLTHETCAKCRICCSFVKEDAWESPLFSKEDMERIKKAGILEDCFDKVCKDGREVYMAHYEFHDEKEILLCPCLDEKKGCILGSEKPFECIMQICQTVKKKCFTQADFLTIQNKIHNVIQKCDAFRCRIFCVIRYKICECQV